MHVRDVHSRAQRALVRAPDEGHRSTRSRSCDAFRESDRHEILGLVAANRIEYYIAIVFLFVFVLVRRLGYGWAMAGLFRGRARGEGDLEVHAAVPALASVAPGHRLRLLPEPDVDAQDRLHGASEKRRKWLRKDAEQ